jgi:hypothetical protein
MYVVSEQFVAGILRVRLGAGPEDDVCACAEAARYARGCWHAWAVRFRRGDFPHFRPLAHHLKRRIYRISAGRRNRALGASGETNHG